VTIQSENWRKFERKLKALIDAIADGFRAKGLQGQLDELENRREALTASLDAPTPAQRKHPARGAVPDQ
jgi:site-specific DNA recombinase